MKISTLLFFILIIFTSCKAQVDLPENLSGKLLYIEDLDGQGGSSSGNFSNLVAYDIQEEKQYILTSDDYYDTSPSYSKSSNRIYFESKRKNHRWAVGLTANSNIFYLDLNTKSIHLFDDEEMRKGLDKLSDEEFTDPYVAINKPILGFITKNDNRLRQFNIYNLEKNKIVAVVDSLYFSFRFDWNKSEDTIAYQDQDSLSIDTETNHLSLFDFGTKRNSNVIKYPKIENDLGDYKYNKLLYMERSFIDDFKMSLSYYDLIKEDKICLGSAAELGFSEIKTPVFKNEKTIFFIGNSSYQQGVFDEDIYQMDIETKHISKITDTHNIKDNLRYYE